MAQCFIVNPSVHGGNFFVPSADNTTFSVGASVTSKDSTTLTLDSVDARWGTCYYGIVVKTGDGRAYYVDTLDISGSDITLQAPLSYFVPNLPDGAINDLTVGFSSDGANSIHQSELGMEAYGRLIYDILENKTESCIKGGFIYRRDCGEDYSGDNVAEWSGFGGFAGTINYQDAQSVNPQASSKAGLVQNESNPMLSANLAADGRGIRLTVPVEGRTCQALINVGRIIYNATVNPPLPNLVEIKADDTTITSEQQNGCLRQYEAFIPEGTANVTFELSQVGAGNLQNLSVGEVVIKERVNSTSNPLRTAKKIVALGDSWFDRQGNGGVVRNEVIDTLEALSQKSIVDSYARGGSTSVYGKAWCEHILDVEGMGAGDCILLHFGINDNTSIGGSNLGTFTDPEGNTRDYDPFDAISTGVQDKNWGVYAANMLNMVSMCLNRGVNVVVIAQPNLSSGAMQTMGQKAARIITNSADTSALSVISNTDKTTDLGKLQAFLAANGYTGSFKEAKKNFLNDNPAFRALNN